ncbi:MAG TPA: tyrosine-type recombinase/integrase [Sedimentisphaerales bacterium]|nr:tyrosine-type recombinase/integrase [Sedimentisphaerales bacterium]
MEKVNEHIREWLSFCRRNYSATTCRTYSNVIHQLQKHISQNGQQFTADAVEKWLTKKFEAGGSRREWNTYLIITRSFCNWRQRKCGIESPIHGKISFLKEDPPKQRVLTEDEYQLLLKHARGMDRDIIIWLANTGLRKSEFRNIRWGDIPADRKFLRITGKGRKFRVVPLNENCREVLQRYKRLPDNEFLQFTQRYPGGEGASWMMRRVAKKINIPICGAHSCRHFFATKMIKRGVNIYKLSKILGHSSISTTEEIYLHLAPVDLLGITDVLDG